MKYESMVDWHIKMDYLRCNPMFSGHPRYDFVIVDCPGGLVFAQLAFVFVCWVGGHDYHLMLVWLLEKSPNLTRRSSIRTCQFPGGTSNLGTGAR